MRRYQQDVARGTDRRVTEQPLQQPLQKWAVPACGTRNLAEQRHRMPGRQEHPDIAHRISSPEYAGWPCLKVHTVI